MRPKTRDRVMNLMLFFAVMNLIVTGSLLYAVIHFQPTIIVDTISFFDKLWPF